MNMKTDNVQSGVRFEVFYTPEGYAGKFYNRNGIYLETFPQTPVENREDCVSACQGYKAWMKFYQVW
jgi:hypothetical protein